MFHLLKHLCKYHDVTVSGFYENGDMEYFVREFPELHGKMHFIHRNTKKFRRLKQLRAYFSDHSWWFNWIKSPELTQTLQNLLDKNDYDILQVEYSSMGYMQLETDAVKILDAHNVEYDNFRRMAKVKWSILRKKFYQHEYETTFREEIQGFRRQDALFVTSERDKKLIAKDLPEKPQFVIPNGVDMEYFSSKNSREEPFSIVFTGAMKYIPNTDGMIYFLEEIFPLIKKQVPQAKVYIVGSQPPAKLKAYASDSVKITGFVDDVRPYIDKASVFVVPLNMGSGTRLKVLEALSMQKPVVSTSVGCEGIDVEDGKHLLIRDNPKEFADAVIQLFEDKNQKHRLIEYGFELMKQKYDWKVVGEAIEHSFEHLTQQPALALSS